MFNEEQPTYIGPKSRVIVFGDVHGDISRVTRALYNLRVITPEFKWIADPPDTIIVQMGDQIDSRHRTGGPEDSPDAAWETLPDVEVLYFFDRLDRLARAHGGRALSLIGNHEFMNTLGVFDYVSANSLNRVAYRYEKFQPGGPLATEILAKRNIVLKIGDILFVHGGLLKSHVLLTSGDLAKINETARKYLRKEPLNSREKLWISALLNDENGMIWTREYLFKTPEQLELREVLGAIDCKKVIVGHNTVSSMFIKGPICFTDAMFSRAYGRDEPVEVLIIENGEEYMVHHIDADANISA